MVLEPEDQKYQKSIQI